MSENPKCLLLEHGYVEKYSNSPGDDQQHIPEEQPMRRWSFVSDDYGIAPWESDPFLPEDAGEEALQEGWRRKAYVELQEKAEWRQRDIQALREMVQDIASLNCPTDDAFLLRFLRAKKFDYDQALKMLERYFLMRKTWPSNFEKALPSLASGVFSHQQQTMLPCRDRLGRRVFLFRAGIWDPALVSLSDIFAANYLLLETVAREPKTQISGLVVILDMGGFGWSHLMHVTTEHIKSVACIIQNTFPLRFREIHVINQSYFFHFVFALIKPFLSETIRSRIQLHGTNMSAIYEAVSPDILPVEFGGTCGHMSNKDMVKIMLERENIFKDLRNYGFNEEVSEEDLSDAMATHPFQGYCLASEPI